MGSPSCLRILSQAWATISMATNQWNSVCTCVCVFVMCKQLVMKPHVTLTHCVLRGVFGGTVAFGLPAVRLCGVVYIMLRVEGFTVYSVHALPVYYLCSMILGVSNSRHIAAPDLETYE
ncbi:hypothetical protein BGW80DRAFT_258898 [Lactifluus volemus]|nr:hypothetical protein BGW80DRAFT_258898 [Lactifluus volemus]